MAELDEEMVRVHARTRKKEDERYKQMKWRLRQPQADGSTHMPFTRAASIAGKHRETRHAVLFCPRSQCAYQRDIGVPGHYWCCLLIARLINGFFGKHGSP